MERWSSSHRHLGSQRLSEMLQQPYDLYKAGWADTYMMGLVNQVAQGLDVAVTQEVTNHLFEDREDTALPKIITNSELLGERILTFRNTSRHY